MRSGHQDCTLGRIFGLLRSRSGPSMRPGLEAGFLRSRLWRIEFRAWALGPSLWGGCQKGPGVFKPGLSWVCVFGPGLFFGGGAKGPDLVSGFGSACLSSGCSAWAFLRGGRRSRPGFWLRVCLSWGPVSGSDSGCLGGLGFGRGAKRVQTLFPF